MCVSCDGVRVSRRVALIPHIVPVVVSVPRLILLQHLYFLGRYEVFRGPPLHLSPSCVVLLARDRAPDLAALAAHYTSSHAWHQGFGGNGGGRFVVLKFLKAPAAWCREVSTRKYEHVLELAEEGEGEGEGEGGKEREHDRSGESGRTTHEGDMDNDRRNGTASVVYDNFNLDPANWSTGLDAEGEGFRWYFNKMTYETWWHRPHCLGDLHAEAVTGGKEDEGAHEETVSAPAVGRSSATEQLLSEPKQTNKRSDDDNGKISCSINKHNVLSILQAFPFFHSSLNTDTNADTDVHAVSAYRLEAMRKGFGAYKGGLVVSPRAGRSLEGILRHEKHTTSMSVLGTCPQPLPPPAPATAIDTTICPGTTNHLDTRSEHERQSSSLDLPSVTTSTSDTRNDCVDWGLILHIVRDLLEALSFLHGQGTVHGDIRRKQHLELDAHVCVCVTSMYILVVMLCTV